MFIYSLKNGHRQRLAGAARSILPIVDSAWSGYKNYITTYSGPAINGYAGGPQITSFTPAMGVQKDYATYVSFGPVNVPTNTGAGTQNLHGYAATLDGRIGDGIPRSRYYPSDLPFSLRPP